MGQINQTQSNPTTKPCALHKAEHYQSTKMHSTKLCLEVFNIFVLKPVCSMSSGTRLLVTTELCRATRCQIQICTLPDLDSFSLCFRTCSDMNVYYTQQQNCPVSWMGERERVFLMSYMLHTLDCVGDLLLGGYSNACT